MDDSRPGGARSDPGSETPPIQNRVVILGAGRGVRGAVPSAIVDIDENGRVLDWLLAAFAGLEACECCVVAGFKADEIVERYPQVRTFFNRDWDRTGPVQSLGLVPLDAPCLFVCYSDVVFRRSAVDALEQHASDADVAIAIDSQWRARYDGRTAQDLARAEKVAIDAHGCVRDIGPHLGADVADAEFAGLLRLNARGSEAVHAAIHSGVLGSKATLPDLIRKLLRDGLRVAVVDLEGAWAELDAKQDLARFVLGTKAESLGRLGTMSHGGEIGPLVAFTEREWRESRASVIDRILSELSGTSLIVRSSALSEDGWLESHAGQNESVGHVSPTAPALAAAIERVLASYGVENLENQVLVQEMLVDVTTSGVVMTRTHATGAPYYVMNFDDTSARTDTVTGGQAARTVFVHRGATLPAELPSALASVLRAVQNIEKLVGHDSLDIEFAVTTDERVHILQVRPISVAHAPEPIDDALVATALGRLRTHIVERERRPAPRVLGHSAQYSVMSDWNPAEIIGTKPKRLALSLYRFLITDEVWARQRAEYGYRDVQPCPLLVDFIGHPYVDVRTMFNSFVPADLAPDLAARLVDRALARLAAEPQLHDKVEFEIALTCMTPTFANDVERLVPDLSASDRDALAVALRRITSAGIARLESDLAALPVFETEFASLEAVHRPPVEAAYFLLAATRRTATLAFAHLARGAFVATSILRSLVTVGALSEREAADFLASIETVLGRMRSDGSRVRRGELEFDAFVRTYGHLRPGTYDITSPRYDAAPEAYLRPVVDAAAEDVTTLDRTWSRSTNAAVSDALRSVGLADNVDAFRAFSKRAIAGREEAKFVFTKALSRALEHVAAYGATLGFTREELAHVRIGDLLVCDDVLADPASFLNRCVIEGKEAYHVTQGVCLPGHITGVGDLFCFEQLAAEPNFVTQSAVEGSVVAAGLRPEADLEGRVVMIPSADPGYDWLLARDIRGLITMYGGANSHMAVRAAELQLPAAIGIGAQLYDALESARAIRLDCASRTITALQ